MTLRQFFDIVELRTKIVSLSTFSISLLYVLWKQGHIPPVKAALVCVAALAVDMGTTGFNSYFDWYRNVDDARFNREDDKVIIHEGVPPGSALIASMSCYVAAMVLGIILTIMSGPIILVLGGLSMLVGFLYSGGPRPISSTPFGELFAGGFLGSVFFMITVYILSGGAAPGDLLASLPQSLFIGAILSTNNACDIEGDRAAGRKTLAMAGAGSRASWPIYIQVAAGALILRGLWVASILPPTIIMTMLPAAVPACIELYRMHARGYSHSTKGRNMDGISRVFMILSASQISGLGFAILMTSSA